MQIKKDDVNTRILSSAENEFYEKGYSASSMRRIAGAAGMTPGNLYSYYSGKEDLLSAVLSGPVGSIRDYIETIRRDTVMDEGALAEITGSIIDLYLNFRRPFMILMFGVRGTVFEGFRDMVTKAVAERLRRDYFAQSKRDFDPFLPSAAAEALISGLLEIFSRYPDDEAKLRDTVGEFLSMMFSDTYYKKD